MPNGDNGPDVPVVDSPDLKQRTQLAASGLMQSGAAEYFWGAFWAALVDGLKAIISSLAGVFDEVISLIVPFLTASQGENTKGFYDLVAALLGDLLGVDVAGDDIANAADQRGRIGAMDQVGKDFINALLNEFLGNPADAGPGNGPGGLPGNSGTPLTPEQGVIAAQSFVGFLLSFSVRQGNVAVLTDALSYHILGQIREYGEMMAQNLGLSRLARRALQPFVQTLIATPLQQALNKQYRPHVMDTKQLASAYIRGDIDRADYADRLTLEGFTDGDIDLLIKDTYTRLPLRHVFILQDNGFLSDADAQERIQALGYNTSDIPLLRQAVSLEEVQGIDREYVKGAIADFHGGLISQSTLESDIDSTTLAPIEKAAYKRNAENRIVRQRKILTLGFMKKAYLDGQVTIDELLQHALAEGYSQDDVDIIETEVLFQQGEKKAAAAAKAKKLAAKSTGSTPPTTPGTTQTP